MKSETCKICDYETFIAAPFGNWIKPVGCIPVCGTYTLHARGILWGQPLWSVLRTLRWNSKFQGWTNKLQLPNDGVKVGLHQHIRGEVLSIAEIEKGDFKKMDNEIPADFDLELNLSCPNLERARLPWDNIERFLYGGNRKWCIAKISPLTTPEELEFLIDKIGFSQIHACNTLPVPKLGGLSGVSLVPYVNEIISLIKDEWPEVTVIAGGGIKNWQDMYRYLSKGADHVSLGTVCFNPLALRKIMKGKNEEKN